MHSSSSEPSRFNRVLVRAILLPVLLMGVLAGVLVWQISHLLSETRWVDHTDQVIAAANRAYRLLVDQETSLRGYLLTGAPDFLESYHRSTGQLEASLSDLERLVADNPPQGERVHDFRTHLTAWSRYAREVMALRAQGKDSRPLVLTRQGKREIVAMRGILGAFIQTEEGLRTTRVEEAQQTVPFVFLSGGGLTLLLGALLAFVSSRQLLGLSRTYERSLREREESEARVAGIIGSAMDAILTVDEEQRLVVFNAAAERMFGCPAAEALGKPLDRFLPERSRAAYGQLLREIDEAAVSGRTMGSVGELCAVRAGGEEFPIDATLSQVKVGGRKLSTVIIRDITERQEAERALRESQALFHDFMHHSPALAFIRDSDGRLVYVNAAYERFFGRSSTDLEGTTLLTVVPEATARELHALYEQVLTEDRPLQAEQSLPGPDGQPHDCRFYLFPFTDATGRRFLGGLVLDVSDQRNLEEQLRQAQKMDAVGRLAGGVAHDFNNMLAVINGYSEIVLDQLPPDSPLREAIEEIGKAGARAAGLTRQLLAFSRKQIVAPKVLDLNEVVTSVDTLLQRLIGEDITLVSLPAPTPALVRADPAHLEQVIVNLAVNARDAMPQGGILTVEVHTVELDLAYAGEHLEVEPGSYVMLAVSDTGTGMDEATQARIFEPFFTTKEHGKGTGLGLATVYGIAKQSGGAVWVYSELGRGTTFKVYLPRVTDTKSSADEGTSIVPVTGTETILLVEDDPMVREMVQIALQQNGYTVLAANSPEEAVRLCRELGQPIHLLLTDVVMPGKSGRETAEEVAALRPAVKVLFMSGYTDDAIVRHGVLHAETAFIQKPFALADLMRKLREVLAKE
jgi:PAS domain S-box-containing protein